MFRRFMIVCWVLFAIPAVVSLVSWPVYFHFNNEVQSLPDEPKDLLATRNFADLLLSNEPESFVETEEQKQRRELKNKSAEWGIAAFAGAGIAIAMLVWNVICHTIHWIWMGRKESE